MLCAHGQSSPVETLDATLLNNKSHFLRSISFANQRGSESLQLLKVVLQ